MAYSSYDENYQKNIAKKKKVVNELLALRRMKYNERVKEQRRRNLNLKGDFVYEANDYKSLVTKADHAAKLLSGSLLESEAIEFNGEHAKDELIGHYVSGKRNAVGGKDVVTDLFQKRKDALKEKQADFYGREVKLINAKAKIGENFEELKDRAKKVDLNITQPLPDYANKTKLVRLVNSVKGNLHLQEQNLQVLKLSHQRYKPMDGKIPPAIDYVFQPEQEEQVNICKEIMGEIVESVLALCFGPVSTVEPNLVETLLQSDQVQWEKMITKGLKQDAILFIIHELIVEVSDEIILEVAELHSFLRVMSKVLAADLVIKSSELVGGNAPRKVKDPKGKIIDQTWSEITTRRLKAKYDIWSHSQTTVSSQFKVPEKLVAAPRTKSKTKINVAPVPEIIENEGDIELLSYEYVTPKTTTVESADVSYKRFVKSECQYWEEMSPSIVTNPISMSYDKVLGISIVAPSFNHQYMAIGTFRGDIIIYSVNWTPFQPVRCVALSKPPLSPIVSIDWSFDGSRIVTLNSAGNVIIWSILFSSPTTLTDSSLIGLPEDKHMKCKCQQLTAIASLTHKNEEFVFKSGPLAASVKDNSIPKVARFNSSLSLTCSQDFLVIGLESGNILNCDLTQVMRKRYEELFHMKPNNSDKGMVINGNEFIGGGNKIAQDIDCELYRGHRAPLTGIFFLNNYGNMISMDSNLIICIWEVSKDYLSGFNWFTPVKKIKIKSTEEILAMKGEETIIFEDIYAFKSAKGKKSKGKAVIENERREAVSELKAIRVNDRPLWEQDNVDENGEEKPKNKTSKFITKTYAPLPEEIVDNVSDRLFHIVTRHKDKNIVVKYSTQEYTPASYQATSILDFKPSFDGSKIYFMFLYDKFGPNIKRHITIVDLNLDQMDMSQSTVIKFNISQDQYDDIYSNPDHAVFNISKVFEVPKTEYIFCNIAGTMQVFSAASGCHVVETAEFKQFKHPDGLKLPRKMKFNPRVCVSLLNPTGTNFYAVLNVTPKDNTFASGGSVIQFSDNSVNVHRRELQNAHNELLSPLVSTSKSTFNTEQAFVRKLYTVRDLPVTVYIQMMIYAMVDNAVAVATGIRMSKDQRTKIWKQDWKRMQDMWIRKNISYAS